MKNSNKTTVLTMVVSLLVAFVLVMSGPEGSMMINSNYVYAKSSGGGGGGSSGGGGGGGSSGGGSSGGSKGGGSSGDSKSSGSDSGGSSKKSIGNNGDDLNDDDHGPPSAPGNDLPGNDRTKNSDPIIKTLGNPCHPVNRCTPKTDHFPRFHDHDHHDHGDVRVIQKTVVVHDRDNNQQTILLNTNTQTGTCFVSSQEVVNVPDLVTQLLNQCTSVTITP